MTIHGCTKCQLRRQIVEIELAEQLQIVRLKEFNLTQRLHWLRLQRIDVAQCSRMVLGDGVRCLWILLGSLVIAQAKREVGRVIRHRCFAGNTYPHIRQRQTLVGLLCISQITDGILARLGCLVIQRALQLHVRIERIIFWLDNRLRIGV